MLLSTDTMALRHADQELTRLRQALAVAREQIAELSRLADQDCLSGLANRRRLTTELGFAIERARTHGRPSALILMDMDGLKALNDRHGHQTGDAAIVHIANIIRQTAPSGLAARIGGDEFVILLNDVSEHQAYYTAAHIAHRIAAIPVECESEHHFISVSTGIAAIGADMTAKSVLARADMAMYADKRGAA